MKRLLIFLPLILILLVTSCGPSVEEIAIQTATEATAIAASWTKTTTPTLTYTPTFTPTITPTSTMTPTITLTPLGGGSGQIACDFCLDPRMLSISMVKPDGTGILFLTDKSSNGASFEWSRNGARLGYFSIIGTGELRKNVTCVIDAFSFNEKCFELGGGGFVLSPDGKELAFPESGFTILNIDSGKTNTLVEEPGYDWLVWSLDWSPDGKEIAYVKGGDIYTINVDNSETMLLVKNAYTPLWSPDGTQIAYIAGNYGQQNILMMNSDGTNKVRLTPGQTIYQMAWSPDKKYIVYSVIVAGSPYSTFYLDLYKVEVASQKISRLTNSHNLLSYTLSPDGSAIAFTLEPKGDEKCNKSFVMDMNGTILSEWKDIACNGKVGPWRPTLISGESASLAPLSKGQSWEFESDSNTEGWEALLDLAPMQVSNGYMLTSSIGDNPWMVSPIFGLDADKFSKIEVRMKSDNNSPIWLAFITSADYIILDGSKVTGFDVIGDGQFHNYVLDMSKMETWKGVVRQIRLKLLKPQTAIEIDYIRITKP